MTTEKFEYVENIKSELSYLTDYWGYEFSEDQFPSRRPGKTIITLLNYKNVSTKIFVEVVLFTCFYDIGIESYYRVVYIKKLSLNNAIPHYIDKGRCYEMRNQKELLVKKDDLLALSHLKETFIGKTIIGEKWPDVDDNETTKHFTTHTGPAYIAIFKDRMKEILEYGYTIIYDESELPPYEQSFLCPVIIFEHKRAFIRVRVFFQARDQEMYVTSNTSAITSNEHSCFAGDSTFDKLKNEMIDAIKNNNGLMG